MHNLAPKRLYRRNLPHVQPPGATFFVTFRLADSIPAALLNALHTEAERELAALEREPDSSERAERIYREQRALFGRWDKALDMGQGPAWLRQPDIAGLVAQAMHYFDGQRYDLLAFCIMPNHVHVVLTPLSSGETCYPLAQTMHSVKGYTARQANLLLVRSGPFWQHESYDHFVRDPAELERIIGYVLHNPVKAKLCEQWRDWPWTYVTPTAGLAL